MDNTEKIKACTLIDDKNIKGFFNDYRFLSNFHICPILYDGRIYGSTEAAYMSGKSNDPEDKIMFQQIVEPKEAKIKGRLVTLRPDWEEVKDKVMYDVNVFKYTFHPDLKARLLGTGDKYLEESNWWKDDYWGTVDGKGENKLGRVLMLIRDQIRFLDYKSRSTVNDPLDEESIKNAMDNLKKYLAKREL